MSSRADGHAQAVAALRVFFGDPPSFPDNPEEFRAAMRAFGRAYPEAARLMADMLQAELDGNGPPGG